MSSELPPLKMTPAYESYALSLPEIVWNYEATSAAMVRSRLMYRALRAWNMAHKHGFQLSEVLYRGNPLAERQLQLCNLWIEGGGAAAAQNLEHWEAIKLFERIISRRVVKVEPSPEVKPVLDLQA